jgi:hypothetical protein
MELKDLLATAYVFLRGAAYFLAGLLRFKGGGCCYLRYAHHSIVIRNLGWGLDGQHMCYCSMTTFRSPLRFTKFRVRICTCESIVTMSPFPASHLETAGDCALRPLEASKEPSPLHPLTHPLTTPPLAATAPPLRLQSILPRLAFRRLLTHAVSCMSVRRIPSSASSLRGEVT